MRKDSIYVVEARLMEHKNSSLVLKIEGRSESPELIYLTIIDTSKPLLDQPIAKVIVDSTALKKIINGL